MIGFGNGVSVYTIEAIQIDGTMHWIIANNTQTHTRTHTHMYVKKLKVDSTHLGHLSCIVLIP